MRRITIWTVLVAIGTVLTLALFTAIVVRNVREMRQLRDETYRIEHTLEVQRELDSLLIAQAEADANARGYLLSGNPAALTSVEAAQAASGARLERLEQLVSDNPDQRARTKTLREAIESRRTRLGQVIAARQNGTIEAALAEAQAAGSGAPRDALRSIIAEMEAHESRLLEVRRDETNLAFQRAVNGRVGSAIVSAALLLGIVLTASLHARTKARREAALVESEQRAHEAAAREQEARGEAERANREKDQFLAVLSHELRTPLNAVLGWTQILQASEPSEPTVVRALASIRRNAEAQQRLVEDLLDVSRIVTGKLPIDRGPLDLNATIGSAIETARPTAEGKGLDLVSNLAATPFMRGDAQRLQQMALNLLSNAVKFTPPGGRVTVTLRDEGRSALLEVSDNGAGIPAELVPHIFERFRQGDGSSTRAHGGLGLGLAIASHIAEAHGGSICVANDGLDHGATFRVVLPYE